MSSVPQRAAEWGSDPGRVGICGFSAGGEAAALRSILDERQYEAIDTVDKMSNRPNFAMLIYPGGLVEKGKTTLREYGESSANVLRARV